MARKWAKKTLGIDPNFAGGWAILGFTQLYEGIYWGESRDRPKPKLFAHILLPA